MPIYFYGIRDAYGAFSNFAHYGFTLDGEYWPTSEHYFQAAKFAGTDYAKAIQKAKTPKIAATLGRSREHPLRHDWEAVKDNVMHRALLAKFTQHPELRELLLNTGDDSIVEASPTDYYWGCGQDGSGKNRLGILLMELRDQLRSQPGARDTSTG